MTDTCHCPACDATDPRCEHGENLAEADCAKCWTWVQPAGISELLDRLALACDTAVPVREMENLCAAAHAEITRLHNGVQTLIDEWTQGVRPGWGAESSHGNDGDAESNGARCAQWDCADALKLRLREVRGEVPHE